MTTTVKRGAGRPAAAARTRKHAQHDPQPRNHTTEIIADEAARNMAGVVAHIMGTTNENLYGRMTVPELKARLTSLGGKPTSRATKGQLMNAILEAERATKESAREAVHGPADAEVDNAPAVVAATEPAQQTAGVGQGTDPKGRAKASKLQDALYPHKWNFDSLTGEGNRVQLVMTRGSEVLTVVWDAGVFNYDETGHLVGDRHTKVRNVSAAIKLGSRPAEEAEAELGRVVSNKRFKPAVPRGVPAKRRAVLAHLDLKTATQEDLAASLAGMTIEWVNRVSHQTEVATVSKDPKFFRLDEREDGRVIQFSTVGEGFRAARLDQIVRVGGSSRRRTQVSA